MGTLDPTRFCPVTSACPPLRLLRVASLWVGLVVGVFLPFPVAFGADPTFNRDVAPILYRHRYVLSRRYGLEDDEFRTLSEVGKGMKLSRERVRQIERDALNRLREANIRGAAAVRAMLLLEDEELLESTGL